MNYRAYAILYVGAGCYTAGACMCRADGMWVQGACKCNPFVECRARGVQAKTETFYRRVYSGSGRNPVRFFCNRSGVAALVGWYKLS